MDAVATNENNACSHAPTYDTKCELLQASSAKAVDTSESATKTPTGHENRDMRWSSDPARYGAI